MEKRLEYWTGGKLELLVDSMPLVRRCVSHRHGGVRRVGRQEGQPRGQEEVRPRLHHHAHRQDLPQLIGVTPRR